MNGPVFPPSGPASQLSDVSYAAPLEILFQLLRY
jgi:hypothetical protein